MPSQNDSPRIHQLLHRVLELAEGDRGGKLMRDVIHPQPRNVGSGHTVLPYLRLKFPFPRRRNSKCRSIRRRSEIKTHPHTHAYEHTRFKVLRRVCNMTLARRNVNVTFCSASRCRSPSTEVTKGVKNTSTIFHCLFVHPLCVLSSRFKN